MEEDLKERLEYIMGSHPLKRSVSFAVSLLLSLSCLFSFAAAGGASLPPDATPAPAGLQADTLETVLPVDEYTMRAWPMDGINYNDLQINMVTRVKEKQVYLCTGTVTAIVGRDPQLVTMKIRKDTVYVVLENATGEDFELGTVYDVFADAAGKHTDMPEVVTYSRVDYMPRLIARYAYKDTDYSVVDLQNKLNDLERKFGTDSANAAVFRDSLISFNPDDLYMIDFAKALMETETAGEYDALLHTHFPGINDSMPGDIPLAQLRTVVDSMFHYAMGVDASKYPWRYEACWAPGMFSIRLGDDRQNIRYYVQTHLNVIFSIDTIPTKEELDSQTILAFNQIPDDTLQNAMEAALDFAHSYLVTGISECVISPAKAPLTSGNIPGKTPVQFNLIMSGSGSGYKMIVDLDTMRVVRAEYGEMETDKDGNVVPKVYTAFVQESIVP